MQTHDNSQHIRNSFIEKLRERADRSEKSAAATITAGTPEEQPLGEWKANGMHCRHMPDDEQGVLRISIGGGEHLPVKLNYCVIRGKTGQCIALLEKALAALRKCPE